jgi:hypothetical protein
LTTVISGAYDMVWLMSHISQLASRVGAWGWVGVGHKAPHIITLPDSGRGVASLPLTLHLLLFCVGSHRFLFDYGSSVKLMCGSLSWEALSWSWLFKAKVFLVIHKKDSRISEIHTAIRENSALQNYGIMFSVF